MEEKKWSSGKILAAMAGVVVAAFLLVVAFVVSVYDLAEFVVAWDEFEAAFNEEYDDEGYEDWLYEEDSDDEGQDETDNAHEDDTDSAYGDNEEFDYSDYEYYEFGDAIRDDLSYEVTIADFTTMADNGQNAMGTATYPVITGENVKNLDVINNAIRKELSVIEGYVNEVSEQMMEGEEYLFDAQCYVTYMDEEIFSMAYVEYGYYDGEHGESYVVSVNIDMENGMVMTNTQLLEIDDEFSIDFRKRSDRQNGENELLDYFSDQEFTEMMNDESSLIIFYTPLGMEVGFNHYYGWVTVTYPDYQDYQNPL